MDNRKIQMVVELLVTVREFLGGINNASRAELIADADHLGQIVAGFESLLRKEIAQAKN